MKVIKSNLIHNIEIEQKPLYINLNETKIDANLMKLILANGQLLSTNFDEKYRTSDILKLLNKDIEIILEEKQNPFHSTNELYFTIIVTYIKSTLSILFDF
ncbi:unnamed protein product [Rotaria sp. Silwood2]|nr:unnamed protein product [Rotaria sp. Silwood2]CAF2820921.1 unnamed protein product [Rotaria sp. Silwood2]CAF4292235.1 unnamed protein product [Rotaria sp. Silwood2]CAF4351503.1 unnamed protein product [Rotaria sp. Silwood2]